MNFEEIKFFSVALLQMSLNLLYRQTDAPTDRMKKTDGHVDREICSQADTDHETDRQTDRWTDRQTDRP